MVGFVWVNVQGHETGGCSWLTQTDAPNKMQCKDGTFCTGDEDLKTNWDCCNTRGGRAKCPPNYPVMCNARFKDLCGGDHCCENNDAEITMLDDTTECKQLECP